MAAHSDQRITLVGLGAIGISFAALHLKFTSAIVSVFDTRPDLEEHLASVLPGYIDSSDPAFSIAELRSAGRLRICSSLEEACDNATLVQEQGPENLDFKRAIWPKVEKLVSPTTHLWSSTSGIAASLQSQAMEDKSRLLVVHPFNPPHIMPLIEIVPAPETSPAEIQFARDYFNQMGSGHRPVVIHKECPGFVGNRLAFTLLREACSLVDQGIISVKDLDVLMEASLGPRWAVQGPFKSYNMGGGAGGINAFLKNLSGTIQNVWDSSVPVNFTPMAEGVSTDPDAGWEAKIIKQTQDAYGSPDPTQFATRDKALKQVLEIQKQM
ncbi:hypothetical protein BP6252_11409 [Coleophoma cylindrospora]|uniref:L-gulonate 3-dehydrogenase n=1 Tax=Coleophoma cylindrospora TaxID=1849047 RepID=A0A3D8QJH5_9HELO|nr:hypothetical protein BP6252_11409 [Coleophoma cylindrospora]